MSAPLTPERWSADWAKDCERTYGRVLTGKRAHWCHAWDLLPVDDSVPEIEACTCELKEE